MCLWSLILFIYRILECGKRVKRVRDAWDLFCGRFKYIACLTSDEAINALRKAQYGIRGPLLPRIPRPACAITAWRDAAGRPRLFL